jgi:two-component system, OmpR family, sensor kinase
LDDAVRRIGQETVRLSGLVEGRLFLARLDEGFVLRTDPVDLVPLVHEVLRDVSESYPGRNVLDEVCTSAVVIGDEVKLRQVVSNLVANALIHTDSDSSVRVRTRIRESSAVIEVIDTGKGMSPEEATCAFDRFWRADSSRSRVSSGLALPIVAAIVKAHGGEVVLDTDSGLGTTVRVVLHLHALDGSGHSDTELVVG